MAAKVSEKISNFQFGLYDINDMNIIVKENFFIWYFKRT